MKVLKKTMWILLGLLTFFIVLALVVPLVVDVDKYRPQIVQLANDRINGKLEHGKLKLSLWGQIRVEVAGLNLSDATGRKVVSVRDAYFHLPFASLLTGSPVLTFKMRQPAIQVLKDRSGKLNVMTLMKTASGEGQPSGAPAAQPPSRQEAVELPGLALRARLGIELRDALVTYRDQATELVTEIKDLNFIMKDISLSHPIGIELWANLDTKMGKAMTVRGPFRLEGKAEPQVKEGKFTQAALQAKINLDQVEILVPGMFEKKKGVEAQGELALTASEREIAIEKLDAKFFNVELRSSGTVTNLAAATASPPGSAVVKYSVRSNTVELKPWAGLVPMLKDFDLGGTVQFDAKADGPADRLAYEANIAMDAVTAKAPKLKTQPRIDGKVHVITDQIDNMVLTMKAPGNDVQVKGKVVSFTKPVVKLEVTSSGMDLDQLIEFPPPKAKTADAKTAAAPEGAPGDASKGVKPAPQDFDALLAPLRENKIARAMTAAIDVNIRMLKAYDVKMTDLTGKMSMKELTASIDAFSMNLWGGAIKATGATAMAPKIPSYRFTASVAGLDLSQAVASRFAFLKNTLLGKANFQMSGEGASYNPDPAIGNLKSKGSMKVENATFATIDVGRMVTEALNKAVERIGDKIPALKGRKFGTLAGRESKYEVVSSDFAISGGKFVAPNFVAKAAPNQGIDLKGNTTVGMKDFTLDARWEVIDTYNLTHARDLAVEQNGVKVEHVLASGDQPVRFPINVGCVVTAPCYSYTEVPEFLAKVALGNVTQAATGRAKEELRKKAESLIQKAAPPAVQDKLKDLGKKLFR